MKKILFYLILFGSAINSYAQNFPTNWGDFGRVGIATTAPLGPLHVVLGGAGGDFMFIQRLLTSKPAGQFYTTGPNSSSMTYNFFTGLRENNNYYHIFNSMTSADALTVKDNSYVGLGTENPNTRLDVRGAALVGGSGGDLNPANGNLSYLSGSGQMVMGWNRLAGNGETDFISNQLPGLTGGFAFITHDNSNAETSLMRIMANGNVGIGTNTPGTYKLAVAGKIRATEVMVEALPWADYVFKPTYRLRPLAEVKTFIDKNHHLPDMPSEAEVAKNGINVGEINKLLTQKVEELTLYLIELKKDNEQQQSIVKQQDKLLKNIQAKLNRLARIRNTGKHNSN
jgi:hypothetical protein